MTGYSLASSKPQVVESGMGANFWKGPDRSHHPLTRTWVHWYVCT